MGQETAVITGVTGQLGSYLADSYLKRGFRVVGFSRRTAEHSTDRVDHLMDHSDFVYLEGDITDMTFLVRLMQKYKPKYVVNTAAQSHVATSFSNSGSTLDISAKGAMNVIDAILTCSPESRLVHLSTSEMFGDQYSTRDANEQKCADPADLEKNIAMWYGEEKYQDEETTLRPQSPYAVAKVAVHHYNRLMRETHSAHLSSLIAFNYESPRRGENFVTQKIVKWFKNFLKELNDAGCTIDDVTYTDGDYLEARKGDDILKFPKLRLGNLDAYRDWSHALDVVKAVDLMLEADEPDDYVVGSGETRTVREFLQVVCKTILGDDDYMMYVVIDPEFFRPAEVDYLRASPNKIKQNLGWKPSISFNKLVEDMCNA